MNGSSALFACGYAVALWPLVGCGVVLGIRDEKPRPDAAIPASDAATATGECPSWRSGFNPAKCVGTADSAVHIGAHLVLGTCRGEEAQRWELTDAGLLRNVTSGHCAGTADGGPMDPGAPLVVWTCTGRADQVWRSVGRELLMNRASDQCVGLADGGVEDGTELIYRDCEGEIDESWRVGACGVDGVDCTPDRCARADR
jgi:hypothetical protein